MCLSFAAAALADPVPGDEFGSRATVMGRRNAAAAIGDRSKSSGDLQHRARDIEKKPDSPQKSAELKDIQDKLNQNAAQVAQIENQVPGADVKAAAAQFSLQTNDNAGALKRANEAVDLSLKDNDPPDIVAEALRTRSMAWAASGDYAKANADAKRVLKMYPDDELADRIEKLTRGRSPLTVKLPAAAPPNAVVADLLERARKSPINRPAGFDATVAHTKEAESGLQMGDYQRMYDEASRAIEKLPDNPKAYMQRAFASLMMKNYDQVIKDAGEGLKRKPGSSSLLGLRAAAYNETGKPQKALEDAARAVEDNPKDPFAWLQKGLAREKLGEGNDEYLGDIKSAAELNPEFEHFYTEALARRNQGGGTPAQAPAGGARGFFSSAAGTAAVIGLCALVVLAGFANIMLRRPAKAPPAPPGEKGPEGRLLAGQYRIVRELGRGGMGIVYEAWDNTLERSVALKRITEDLKANPDEAGRLLKEAKTVAALRHEGIVVIHNAFQDAGDVYLVFELVQGETLEGFLESRGRIPPAETVGIVAPLCSALDYAHKAKVIHRDLKPANVMLEAGRAKIMDFGIARRMRGGKGVTMTEMVIGTPAYMAPELNFGEVSPESDLYALGVVVYQMLTGRLPFEGQGLQQDKFDARFAPASSFVKNAPGIDAFFKRALDPDRGKRFHSGAEMLEAYKKAIG